MGMFTTFITADNREWQTKTGHDQCDTFRIGDQLPVKVMPDEPGWVVFGDGILELDACDNKLPSECLLIIKNGKALTVLPRPEDMDHVFVASVFCDYDLAYPDPSLWSQEAWAKKAMREYTSHALRNLKSAAMRNVPPDKRAAFSINEFTMSMIQEEGFFRQIMGIAPLRFDPTFEEKQIDIRTKYKEKALPPSVDCLPVTGEKPPRVLSGENSWGHADVTLTAEEMAKINKPFLDRLESPN